MKEILDLNAGWKTDWTEFQNETSGPDGIRWRFDAVVPGDAHLDLMRKQVL